MNRSMGIGIAMVFACAGVSVPGWAVEPFVGMIPAHARVCEVASYAYGDANADSAHATFVAALGSRQIATVGSVFAVFEDSGRRSLCAIVASVAPTATAPLSSSQGQTLRLVDVAAREGLFLACSVETRQACTETLRPLLGDMWRGTVWSTPLLGTKIEELASLDRGAMEGLSVSAPRGLSVVTAGGLKQLGTLFVVELPAGDVTRIRNILGSSP